nr:unnamed protein product [Digitaria exilis]
MSLVVLVPTSLGPWLAAGSMNPKLFGGGLGNLNKKSSTLFLRCDGEAERNFLQRTWKSPLGSGSHLSLLRRRRSGAVDPPRSCRGARLPLRRGGGSPPLSNPGPRDLGVVRPRTPIRDCCLRCSKVKAALVGD